MRKTDKEVLEALLESIGHYRYDFMCNALRHEIKPSEEQKDRVMNLLWNHRCKSKLTKWAKKGRPKEWMGWYDGKDRQCRLLNIKRAIKSLL